MPKQLLLIDDSVTIARMVEITFAQEDFTITAVRSGAEATARVKTARPDVVLLDAALPEASGYDVCSELRSAGLRDVPIVLLTSSFNPYDEGKGKDCGADGHFDKPFETQALIDRVTGAIAQRASASAAPDRPLEIQPAAAPVAVAPAPEAPRAAPSAAAAPQKPRPAPRATLVGIPKLDPALGAAAGSRAAAPAAPPPIASAKASAPAPRAVEPPRPRAAEVPAPKPLEAALPRLASIPADVPRMPRAPLIPHVPTPVARQTLASRPVKGGARGPEYEAIAKLSREVIEQVVWEVVPELAESMIRAELEKLVKQRQA